MIHLQIPGLQSSASVGGPRDLRLQIGNIKDGGRYFYFDFLKRIQQDYLMTLCGIYV